MVQSHRKSRQCWSESEGLLTDIEFGSFGVTGVLVQSCQYALGIDHTEFVRFW